MAIEDLGPAERLAVGAIGRPGDRRFYLQVTANGVMHSLLAEKEQVAALAVQGLALLQERSIRPDPEATGRMLAEGLDIVDPGHTEGRFRVGSITIGMGPSELLAVTIESVEEDDGVSFVIAPEQFRAMAEVALQVVAAGRPTCPWCRGPMDLDGHECPARNGHRGG